MAVVLKRLKVHISTGLRLAPNNEFHTQISIEGGNCDFDRYSQENVIAYLHEIGIRKVDETTTIEQRPSSSMRDGTYEEKGVY